MAAFLYMELMRWNWPSFVFQIKVMEEGVFIKCLFISVILFVFSSFSLLQYKSIIPYMEIIF